jgi:hypothetical protein
VTDDSLFHAELEQTLLDGLAAQLEEAFYLQGRPVIFLEGRVSQACHPRKGPGCLGRRTG